MTFTWSPDAAPPAFTMPRGGVARAGLRASAIMAVLGVGVAAILLARLAERPVCGQRRPWTPVIAQWVWRATFAILRMRHETVGAAMAARGAVVANHTSWLDILVLGACERAQFVAKSEVAGWPAIGFLARLVGTAFIARDRRQAHGQQRLLRERLLAGQKLLFFPEGTSSDGFRVLHFKSTLFEAFFNEPSRPGMHIQPVSVVYEAPPGEDPRFYGWWGEMSLGPHLLRVLAVRRNGAVRVIRHAPLRVANFADRKALARAVERAVRAGMPPDRQGAG